MENPKTSTISVNRLRLGVVFLFLWWLPFWIVTPALADLFGISRNSNHSVLIEVIIAQSILGIIGAIVTGKEVVIIIKHTPFKRVPKTIYLALKSGQIN